MRRRLVEHEVLYSTVHLDTVWDGTGKSPVGVHQLGDKVCLKSPSWQLKFRIRPSKTLDRAVWDEPSAPQISMQAFGCRTGRAGEGYCI
jgi:hypothetical protein